MAVEKIVNLKVQDDFGKTDNAVKSLRTQLREAQQEVAAMADKFGATSAEAVQAAKRAAELKDRIGDAKDLTDAFNPDAKFNALTKSLAGVAGGFTAVQGAIGLFGEENKDLEKTLLKVQSAMALSTGIQQLGEARDSFKALKTVAVDSFNAIKGAIGSTGIGLLVIALGAIYTYWDDIKGAVSGVSAEQEKLNEKSSANLKTQQEKLKAIDSQDNILKLQGKSETEILTIKQNQTKEVIAAAKLQLQNTIATTKAQVEAAQRNKDILQGILTFLTAPISALLKGIDLIGQAVGKNFDLYNKFTGGLASLMFDPDEVKAEGDAAIKEQQKTLAELENQAAGYELQIRDIKKKAQDEKNAKDKEAQEKEDAKRKEAQERLAAAQKEQLEAIKQQEAEVTKAIEEAIQERANFGLTAQEIEEQAVKDKYFRLIELAKQQGKATEDLEIAQMNAINDIRLKAGEKQAADFKAQKEQELAVTQAVEEAKAALLQQGFAVAEQGINVLKTVFEKNKALQKALIVAESAMGIAKIIINTRAANAGAVAKYALLPGGQKLAAIEIALNNVSAGLGIAANIAATSKALSALGGGGASGGGGGSDTGGSAPAAPQFNIVGQNPNNQLAATIAGQQGQPIRAYVVGQEVTTQQSLDRQIRNTATFNS